MQRERIDREIEQSINLSLSIGPDRLLIKLISRCLIGGSQLIKKPRQADRSRSAKSAAHQIDRCLLIYGQERTSQAEYLFRDVAIIRRSCGGRSRILYFAFALI